MKSYKRYLEKIGDFQIRAIDPFQDTSVDGNFRFGDTEDLNSLEEFVLKELSDAAPGNVKLKLKKLREMNKGFMDFDKNYPKLYARAEKNILYRSDLFKFFPFALQDKQQITIATVYLKTFYQSVSDRQKSLLHLIENIEDVLVGHKEILI